MNLSDAAVTQVTIPVDDSARGIAFYRVVLGILVLFADRDGTPLALMSEVAIAGE